MPNDGETALVAVAGGLRRMYRAALYRYAGYAQREFHQRGTAEDERTTQPHQKAESLKAKTIHDGVSSFFVRDFRVEIRIYCTEVMGVHIDIVIVAAYLGLLIWMGLRGGEKVTTAADFFAGGKTYGAPVIFMSLAASFIGGGFSVGNAAYAFEQGIGMTLALCGFGVVTILTGKFLAPGTARFPGAETAGDIIAETYGKRAGVAYGVVAFLTCACVVGAQMEAMGEVFHTLIGIPPAAGVLIGCGIVLLYSTVGGLQSVIAADMVQFALLAVGMPLLLIAAVWRAGGVAAVVDNTPAAFFDPLYRTSLPAFLSFAVTVGFGEALVPPYTARLLIGKHLRATVRGTVGGGVFSIPFFAVTGMIGLAARALAVTDTPADAMPALILAVLPVGLRGLIMAAMISIMLSAADGFLNGAAVALVHDVLLPLRPHTADKRQLTLLRAVNFLTGGAAVTLALCIPDVLRILELSYTFWAPLAVVPLSAALLGIKTRPAAFWGGMLSGGIAAAVWEFVLCRPWGVGGVPIGIAAHLLAAVLLKKRAVSA